MKRIELRRDHVDIEHDGELYRLGGELGNNFIAWRSWIERLISKDQTAPLTEEEQDQVMCNVEKYWNDDELLITFVNDQLKVICATGVIIAKIGKGYIDFRYRRKIVRAWGKKRFNTYRLKAEKIEWVDSDSVHGLNEEEKIEFIEEAMKFCHRSYYIDKVFKIIFVNKKGKKIKAETVQ